MNEKQLAGVVDAPPALREAVEQAAAAWTPAGLLGRLWQRDPTVWTGGDEGRWLGWLDVPRPDGAEVRRLEAFVDRARRDGFVSTALLGMGGSSLCPEMLQRIFGGAGGIELRVLDSTDPAQLRGFEAQIDLDRTLFVVSSKSGATLETSLLHAHFFERVRQRAGSEAAGARFVAVTDAGSALDRLATERGFRAVFHGEASIGGRYSALSYFGLLPAALIGIDLRLLLDRARAMAEACGAESPAASNPGVQLGLWLGLAARAGRNKTTLVTAPGLDGLGAWIEQLLAESTGKDGVGIIPVDGERPDDPAIYRDDRLFVSTALGNESDEGREKVLDALARAGHPVVRLHAHDRYDVAAECFRWELATAVAGAVLGVHPFDQPDVEASKVATRAITSREPASGRAAAAGPVAELAWDAGVIRAYAARPYSAALRRSVGAEATLAQWVAAHIRRLRSGSYFAVLALSRDVRTVSTDSRRPAAPGARGDGRGDHRRFRTALPALDGAGAQGRSRGRTVPRPLLHGRHRRGRPGRRAHVRHGEGRAGGRRLRRARGAPPALAPTPSRWRGRERPGGRCRAGGRGARRRTGQEKGPGAVNGAGGVGPVRRWPTAARHR